jgi:hypothetical protein
MLLENDVDAALGLSILVLGICFALLVLSRHWLQFSSETASVGGQSLSEARNHIRQLPVGRQPHDAPAQRWPHRPAGGCFRTGLHLLTRCSGGAGPRR